MEHSYSAATFPRLTYYLQRYVVIGQVGKCDGLSWIETHSSGCNKSKCTLVHCMCHCDLTIASSDSGRWGQPSRTGRKPSWASVSWTSLQVNFRGVSSFSRKNLYLFGVHESGTVARVYKPCELSLFSQYSSCPQHPQHFKLQTKQRFISSLSPHTAQDYFQPNI